MPAITPSRVWEKVEGHHLITLKNPWYRLVSQLQNSFTELTVDFWARRGGQTIHLPITTGSISSPMGRGSDSSPVSVDLFGQRTYLADSMQFALEYGCRLADRDCYYIMPSFRGEATDSTHLAQFFHSEAEIRGGLDDVITVVQQYLSHVTAGLLERHADVIGEVRDAGLAEVERLAEGDCFRRVTFEEAAELLGGRGVVEDQGWRNLTRVGERLLMDKLGPFTWVTQWDHLAVPFYQAFGEDRRTAQNGDLLFGLGEIVGAGERHDTTEQIEEALALHEVDPEPYRWYCDMREVHRMRTAGFGMGIERFLAWLLDHDDVRDFQLLPRENGRNIVP